MAESETVDTTTAMGVLALHVHFQGSKSERLQPCLEPDGGEVIFLHVDGENPFEEPTLRDLLGSRVQVTGTMKRHTLVLSADDIVILDDDAEALTQEDEDISVTESTEEFPEPDDAQAIPEGSESQTNGDQSVPDTEPHRKSSSLARRVVAQ